MTDLDRAVAVPVVCFAAVLLIVIYAAVARATADLNEHRRPGRRVGGEGLALRQRPLRRREEQSLTAQTVLDVAVVDQPRDKMAAARAGKRVRQEQRNRLAALKARERELFDEYMRLRELDDAPAGAIREARSAAWDAHHLYAREQNAVDHQVAAARGDKR